jgi:predicted aldo/keto reductase-like oxidoreductase
MDLFFPRKKRIQALDVNACPLILAGGYEISGGDTRLAWCAGLSQFFWTPLWPKMTKGLKEILRCAPRNEVVIISGNPTASGVVRSLLFNQSLRVRGIDRIDIWLELWVKDMRRVDSSVMSWVRQKKREKKIRLFGISTHRHEVVEEALKRDDIDVIMLRYNAAHHHYDRTFATHSSVISNKIVIAYTSTKWGYLITRDSGWPVDYDVPTAADCYGYALSNNNINGVLIGPKNRDELEGACAIFTYSHEQWERRKAVLEQYGEYIYGKYGVHNSYRLKKRLYVIPR